jgi:hypothetical protein
MYIPPGWLYSYLTTERCSTTSVIFCISESLGIAEKLITYNSDNLDNCLPTFLELAMAGLSSTDHIAREDAGHAIYRQYRLISQKPKTLIDEILLESCSKLLVMVKDIFREFCVCGKSWKRH